MSKKRNKMQELLSTPVDESDSVAVASEPRARSRNFTAKPCASCVTDRPAGTNFSRVYATRGKVRYCRCENCGHIWKDSDSQ